MTLLTVTFYPATHKVVPVEPTEEMLREARYSIDLPASSEISFRDILQAAFYAAPDAPPGVVEHPAPAQPVGPTIWPEWANYAAFDGNHVIFYAERPEIVGDSAVPAGGKWGGAVNFFVVDRPAYGAQPVERQELSDGDIDALLVKHGKGDDGFRSFARAIIAADRGRA
jgi:hypothetical protein